jgi:hypothetical protein
VVGSNRQEMSDSPEIPTSTARACLNAHRPSPGIPAANAKVPCCRHRRRPSEQIVRIREVLRFP